MCETWNTQRWVSELQKAGQEHLFSTGANPEDVKRLIQSVKDCHAVTPGGVFDYIERAKKLLQDSMNNVNVFQGFIPSAPDYVRLFVGSPAFAEMETVGMSQLPLTCFVLVAGGLGERLGYPGIKVALPTELSTGTTYMDLYARHILAFQDYATQQLNRIVILPLAIMTSDDTHDLTVELLKSNDYFGLNPDQVTILKQGKVPALVDITARMAVSPKDSFTLETKPHGHGDVHSLLHASGLPNEWNEQGYRWLIFFQDTNALAFRSMTALLGVSATRNMFMNSLVISRQPAETVGSICTLSKMDGTRVTLNVEYNQLDALLRETVDPLGDVADETGYSIFPGNTNCFVVQIPRYVEVLRKSGGVIPEFVNPKFTDKTRTAFCTPARLECMMQDLPKLSGKSDIVGATELERWISFSTVKNNRKDAIAKAAVGSQSESAFSGESDQYYACSRLLSMAATAAGCSVVQIPEPSSKTLGGVKYRMGPRVVLMPSFGISFEQIKTRIVSGSSVVISNNSTVILEGNVRLAGLHVDGTLVARAVPPTSLVIQDLVVSNKGWEIQEVTDKDSTPTYVDIRGYRIVRHEQTTLEGSTPWM